MLYHRCRYRLLQYRAEGALLDCALWKALTKPAVILILQKGDRL